MNASPQPEPQSSHWSAAVAKSSALEALWIGFAVALVTALMVVWAAFRGSREYAERERWVAHSELAVRYVEQAGWEKQNALDAMQGYRLNGNAMLLDGFRGALARVGQHLERLRVLVAGNDARMAARVRALEDSIARLDRLGAELAAIAVKHDHRTAIDSPQFAQLRLEVENVHRRLIEIDQDEHRLLKERSLRARDALRHNTVVIAVGGSTVLLCLIFVGAGASFLLSRYRHTTRALEANRRELEQANATLEKRVRDRSAALAEQNALLESVLNSMPDAVVMVDKELRPILMNPAAVRQLRADVRRPADWLADYDVFPAGSTTVLTTDQPFVSRGLAGEVIEGYELRVRERATGRELWVDASVRPVKGADGEMRSLLVLRDVTGRHDARIEHALFALVASFVPDAVMSLSPDGVITSWNPGAERLFGYRSDEVIGNPIEVALPEDSPDERQRLAEILRSGRPLENLETRRKRKDGTAIDIIASASAIRTLPGRIDGYAVIARDNTQQKRLHEQMQRARDLAIEAAQTRAEFLANMSHEIRTPLNAIVGMAELLQLTDLTAEQRERAAVIESSSKLLIAIVNDILDFTKLSAGRVVLEKITFDLRELARTTVNAFAEAAAQKGIALDLHLEDDLPMRVKGDPNRLRQILNNLISNAIKFTSEGFVAVRIARANQSSEQESIRFEVADTGIGIEPNVQKRLFEPFVQAESSTTRRYGGTGLGLVISAQLARQMGGEIMLDSEPEKGATFSFIACFEKASEDDDAEAPRISKPPLAEPAGGPLAEAAASNGAVFSAQSPEFRILVVEDNPVNRELAAEQLTVLGYHSDLVADAPGALEALARQNYDLVLMDCELPVMDGYEATREIRRREAGRRHTVIIAMTAHAAHEQRELCLGAGMDDYLSKPVRLQTLSATLALWSRRGTRRPNPEESAQTSSDPVPGAARAEQELDPATLADLHDLSEATGEDVLRKLVEAFLSELPRRVTALKAALEAGDLNAVARAAHAMRSAAGLGAIRYANLCAEVERNAVTNNRSEAISLAGTLLTQSDRLPAVLMWAAALNP